MIADKIQISRKTWEELKSNSAYQELIEEIEDREALEFSQADMNNNEAKSWENFKLENPIQK